MSLLGYCILLTCSLFVCIIYCSIVIDYLLIIIIPYIWLLYILYYWLVLIIYIFVRTYVVFLAKRNVLCGIWVKSKFQDKIFKSLFLCTTGFSKRTKLHEHKTTITTYTIQHETNIINLLCVIISLILLKQDTWLINNWIFVVVHSVLLTTCYYIFVNILYLLCNPMPPIPLY